MFCTLARSWGGARGLVHTADVMKAAICDAAPRTWVVAIRCAQADAAHPSAHWMQLSWLDENSADVRATSGRFFSAAASLPTLAFSSPPGRIDFPRGISPSAPAPSPPFPCPAIPTSIFHFPHYHSLSRGGVVIGPTSTGLEEPNSKWHCNPMSSKNDGRILNNLYAVLCVSCFCGAIMGDSDAVLGLSRAIPRPCRNLSGPYCPSWLSWENPHGPGNGSISAAPTNWSFVF